MHKFEILSNSDFFAELDVERESRLPRKCARRKKREELSLKVVSSIYCWTSRRDLLEKEEIRLHNLFSIFRRAIYHRSKYFRQFAIHQCVIKPRTYTYIYTRKVAHICKYFYRNNNNSIRRAWIIITYTKYSMSLNIAFDRASSKEERRRKVWLIRVQRRNIILRWCRSTLDMKFVRIDLSRAARRDARKRGTTWPWLDSRVAELTQNRNALLPQRGSPKAGFTSWLAASLQPPRSRSQAS